MIPAWWPTRGFSLPAALAQRLGLRQLIDQRVRLGRGPGAANAGQKTMTVIASILAGGDCISDADALRDGNAAAVLGCDVAAPSMLG